MLPNVTIDRVQAADATSREIDIAVRDIVGHGFERASEILMARRADLDKGVELLLERETLSAADFPAIQRPRTSEDGAAAPAHAA
jgi:cell division protease FtsH